MRSLAVGAVWSFAVILVFLIMMSVSIHRYPHSTSRIERACLSFCDEYFHLQFHGKRLSGSFDPKLTPAGGSAKWGDILPKYQDLRKFGYECHFDIHALSYSVSCYEGLGMGPRLGYRLDESGTIRVARGLATSSSRITLQYQTQANSVGAVAGRSKSDYR